MKKKKHRTHAGSTHTHSTAPQKVVHAASAAAAAAAAAACWCLLLLLLLLPQFFVRTPTTIEGTKSTRCYTLRCCCCNLPGPGTTAFAYQGRLENREPFSRPRFKERYNA